MTIGTYSSSHIERKDHLGRQNNHTSRKRSAEEAFGSDGVRQPGTHETTLHRLLLLLYLALPMLCF